jgi:uncharacterized protein YjbI with pentapeptide repeats
MNALSGPRRWRPRPLALATLLSALLVAGLLATLTLAPAQATTRLDATLRALGGWLRATRWAWPLAAALTLAALASPPARRRWPRPARRIPPATGMFAGLVGLASLAATGRPRLGLLAVGVAAAVGLLAAWVVVLPRRLAPPLPTQALDALGHRERLETVDARTRLQNDLRTTALQAIAGLAVLAGAVLGFQQLGEDRQQATAARKLTLQGQASERFTRAIDQLGSDRPHAQLGGIYGLEQIAQQAPDNRLAVAEVLAAYLHHRIPRPATPPPDLSRVEELRVRAPDAQAALTVLGRRHTQETDPWLDLRFLDLRRVSLSRADLRGVRLSGADLRGAVLFNAGLSDADVLGADLREAFLGGADLRGSRLGGADLRGAYFADADLRGAGLGGADLRGVFLLGADLRGVFLLGADLRGARLRGVDLRDATANQRTRWPQGFDWRGAGVRVLPV